MEEPEKSLLTEVEADVADHFTKFISAEYVYHDYQHTRDVVEAVKLIGEGYELSAKEMEILQLAAWFHDTGHDKGSDGHELRSKELAERYLTARDYNPEDLKIVVRCIMATRLDIEPTNLLEQIMCDGDLSHLGSKLYWDRCWRVRQELLLTQNKVMSEKEWFEFELDFLERHNYYTEVARELYGKRKKKYIKQLKKQKLRLDPEVVEFMEELEAKVEKKKKKKNKKGENGEKEIKQLNLGRGVETMYRTTYRTHVNLSSIADNKANIMLSINAIIISIVVSSLVPQFGANPTLVAPTILLLSVCLMALVFAILSTRPKITEGKFTREDIEHKRANLLFFGNFYKMDINDFHHGMMEMIKDSDFLYSSMTRDLYYLGVVLAKKYRYLRICYNIFMYGLIISVAVFALVFLTQ